MRKDQIDRLNELSEKLTDVFLEEADPDQWPGSGKPLADLTMQDRGDRYWSKKNAAATLTVIMKTVNIVGVVQQGKNPADPQSGDDMDKEIKEAEKEAERLLNKIQNGVTKEEFDKRVHGKR